MSEFRAFLKDNPNIKVTVGSSTVNPGRDPLLYELSFYCVIVLLAVRHGNSYIVVGNCCYSRIRGKVQFAGRWGLFGDFWRERERALKISKF